MSKGAIIMGCGGHARVVASMLVKKNNPIVGFLDEAYVGKQETIFNADLFGLPNKVNEFSSEEVDVYLSQGKNLNRKSMFDYIKIRNYVMPSLIHSDALIDKNVFIGNASHVCMGAMLATEVQIGEAVIINTGVSVDHETKIGNFSHLAPGVIVAGRTNVGDNVFIGIGSKIAESISIGDNVVIGAGSIVLKDVPSDTKVVGVYN